MPKASVFQKKVHEITKKIPKGRVLTYKEVSKLAGLPRAWRAVGNILHKNRNSKIPCHRVIRSDGKAGGYKDGTEKKITLLKKEGIIVDPYGKITSRLKKQRVLV